MNLGSKGHPGATQRLSRCLAVLSVLWLQGPNPTWESIKFDKSSLVLHSIPTLLFVLWLQGPNPTWESIKFDKLSLVLHSNRTLSLAPSASLASEVDYDSTHGPWSYSANAYRTLAPRASATSDPAQVPRGALNDGSKGQIPEPNPGIRKSDF